MASNISWNHKHTEPVHDNNFRTVDTNDIKHKHLQSEVIPLKQYPTPKRQRYADHDVEHELNHKKEFQKKMNNSKLGSSRSFYESLHEGGSSTLGNKKLNLIQALNNNQSQGSLFLV